MFFCVITGRSSGNPDAPFNPHPYGSPEYEAFHEARRKEDAAIAGYREISKAFNRTLAGKYPFGTLDARDASRRDVCDFYHRHDRQIKAVRSELSLSKDAESGVRFLNQLDTAGAFLAGTVCSRFNQPIRIGIHPDETEPVTSKPDRVWTLTDDFGRARFPHGAPTIDWRFGAPLALTVTWANHTGMRPRPATMQDRFETPDSATVRYRMQGNWTLMRFVETYRAPYEWDRIEDSSTVTLAFRAPLVPILASSGPRSNQGPPEQSAATASSPVRESWVSLKVALRFEHYGPGKPRYPLKWPAPFPIIAPEL